MLSGRRHASFAVAFSLRAYRTVFREFLHSQLPAQELLDDMALPLSRFRRTNPQCTDHLRVKVERRFLVPGSDFSNLLPPREGKATRTKGEHPRSLPLAGPSPSAAPTTA